ncbi:MAG: PilZ domain-containing protein [Candidatus Omnitrophica bacterium]|nr:PilZ domain-containing protein [Candidatus Omnitrophota bacterium]
MILGQKRQSIRLETFIDGAFHIPGGVDGLIMLKNINTEGCGISVDHSIRAGSPINLEIRFPGMPVFATGRVIWIKEKEKSELYKFDAGVKLWEIAPTDHERILNSAFAI